MKDVQTPKQVKRNENTNKPKPAYQSKPSKQSYAEITSKSQNVSEVLENNAQTNMYSPQIADLNQRRNTKNNQHHERKSPFERNSNAHRNTFYQPLASKSVEKKTISSKQIYWTKQWEFLSFIREFIQEEWNDLHRQKG